MTGGPLNYSGPMPMKHMSLGLEGRHFEAWLELWRRHCRTQFAPADAEELIRAAESIGERLQSLTAYRRGECAAPPSLATLDIGDFAPH